MEKADFSIIVLAAGQGKRMKSPLTKVLHKVGEKPMLVKTIELLQNVNPREIIVVVSPSNKPEVEKELASFKVTFAIQPEALGTADAAKFALGKINKSTKTVAIINGDDSAFYKPQTILGVFKRHTSSDADVTFVTLEVENPQGIARIIRKKRKAVAIVEEKDATRKQKEIKEINDGLYFFKRIFLEKNLPKIKPSPHTREFYITTLIQLAFESKLKVETYKLKDASQWQSINTPEDLIKANKKLVKNIHIMGIAGAGAAAVAGIAQAYGYNVSGCDLKVESAYSTAGIKIKEGHNAKHLKGVDLLVISPAITKLNFKNNEALSAKKKNIPVVTWQEFQGEYLQDGKFVIAVAGAYGKTTTTSMVAKILTDANLDPTCEIGAKVIEWGQNFRVGKSKYYVCEADEYNNNFLNFKPDIAVILNINWDHPDFFKTKEEVRKSFRMFMGNIKPQGVVIIPSDLAADPLLKGIRADITIHKVDNFAKPHLSIIGDFRKENADAAQAVAKVLGLDLGRAKRSVEEFKGTGRRLEYKGKFRSKLFYDDYAVQPYTVVTTANALKKKYQKRKVLLILEPHTFSRVEMFFEEFANSLRTTYVDEIYITEVYPARETGNRRLLSKKLQEAVGSKAKFTGSVEQTAEFVKKNMENYDVICSMGAGNVYKIYDLVSNN